MKERFAIPINDGWRLTEDGRLQWNLQRENPKAKSKQHRWVSVAFCGSREGLLDVALTHHRIIPTDTAYRVLQRLPETYQPGALERVAGEMLAEAA